MPVRSSIVSSVMPASLESVLNFAGPTRTRAEVFVDEFSGSLDDATECASDDTEDKGDLGRPALSKVSRALEVGLSASRYGL